MLPQVASLKSNEVASDFRRFRERDFRWSLPPETFLQFDALTMLVVGPNGSMAANNELVVRRLAIVLDDFVTWLAEQNALLDGDPLRPLSTAAEHLLRRNSATAERKTLSLDEAVAKTWSVRDRDYPDPREMAQGTFTTDYKAATYDALAIRFLEFVESYEPPVQTEGWGQLTEDKPEDGRRRSRVQRRRVPIILAIAAVVVGICALTFALNGGEETPASSGALPQMTKPPVLTEGVGIAVGLQAKNRDYQPSWGVNFDADPKDRISFDLWVINRSQTPLPRMTAWLQHKKRTDTTGRLVRALLVNDKQRTVLRSPWVRVKSTTDQFGLLMPGTEGPGASGPVDRNVFVLDAKGDTLGASMQVPTSRRILKYFASHRTEIGTWVDVPQLSASEKIHLQFNARWSVYQFPNQSTAFAMASPRVQINGRVDATATKNFTVKPGDVVALRQMISGASNVPIPSTVRVRVSSNSRRDVIHARVFVTSSKEPVLLGSVKLSTTDATPISLDLRPNTTTVASVDPRHCGDTAKDNWTSKTLQNSILTSGVDVGSIGGFAPRDPCRGRQFNKHLQTSFQVVRAD